MGKAAYLVFEIEVTDPEAYEEYRKRAAPVLARHAGEFIIRRAPLEALEGPGSAADLRYFVLKFPSREAARQFYFSDDYQSVLPLRLEASRSRAYLVEGVKDRL